MPYKSKIAFCTQRIQKKQRNTKETRTLKPKLQYRAEMQCLPLHKHCAKFAVASAHKIITDSPLLFEDHTQQELEMFLQWIWTLDVVARKSLYIGKSATT